jgi:hypothetical protein
MKLGIRAKLCINDGTYLSPDWVVVDDVSDLNVEQGENVADSSTRGTRVDTEEVTSITWSVTGTIRNDADGVGANAFHDARIAGTPIDILVLDAPLDEEGARGQRADWNIKGMSTDQGRGTVQFFNFTLTPSAANANIPQEVVVESGILVYTDMTND